MAYKFNPFTDTLDIVGSGGGSSYIDGEVEYHADLPVTVGTPAVNSAFLVRKGQGFYFLTRKPAGIWVRELNNGNLDDWKYAGTFSDLYRDANFRIINDADTSKQLAFSLSGLTTATTRTLTVPNASGTIARTEDFASPPSIGNTTPAAGSFTTLAANNGVPLTASAPVLDLAQTWNNAAVDFVGANINANVGGAGAGNSSIIFRVQLNGSSMFTVPRFGGVSAANGFSTAGNIQSTFGSIAIQAGGSCVLTSDANDTLAQRRGTNPQTFRLYNTFTDANNYERGFMRWSSNVLQIGTEAGGTGSARTIDFSVGATNLLSIRSNEVRTVALTSYVSATGSVAQVGLGQFGFVAGGANNAGGILFYNGNGGGVDTRLGLDASNVLAIKSGTAAQSFRIYNTTIWERANFRWASNEFIIDAEAGGTGTLRGIKIGSATSSLLGFYGVTPVDQPATVADPAGGGTVDTEARTAINAIIDRLQELGLIA